MELLKRLASALNLRPSDWFTRRVPPPPQLDVASITDPFIRIEKSRRFRIEDIDLISETYRTSGTAVNTPWDHFRHTHLVLPDWFKDGLDPMSDAYFQQQMRLWNVLAGVDREYVPQVDEAEIPLANVDAIRRPGFYLWRHRDAVRSAADHMLATGMLMKHSGLEPGMWALEYGAGFANTALALARMGVNVDTVDISPTFCKYVKQQADFFAVNLTPFEARFGENPRGEQKYDLIWFYESFHHCLDFKNVVPALKRHLTPAGKILMAGEPIAKREYVAVPYPWGLRLESDVVAVIRNHHWFELGYSEDFVTQLFINSGYVAECFECPVSDFGVTYSFRPRTECVDLGKQWLACIEAEGWHAMEAGGRWTRAEASLSLDQTDTFQALQIAATNHHRRAQTIEIEYGETLVSVRFAAHERKTIRIDAAQKSPKIKFKCERIPGRIWRSSGKDKRVLGIFVHQIDYL
jgi:2-polyprenyl-3-methyl-5-hydroxy-6-metoxy-1,4-benzoquinol methylase